MRRKWAPILCCTFLSITVAGMTYGYFNMRMVSRQSGITDSIDHQRGDHVSGPYEPDDVRGWFRWGTWSDFVTLYRLVLKKFHTATGSTAWIMASSKSISSLFPHCLSAYRQEDSCSLHCSLFDSVHCGSLCYIFMCIHIYEYTFIDAYNIMHM